MWSLRRRVAVERLPPRRLVLRFRFTGVAPGYRGPRLFWLILEPAQADLCVADPGFEVDLWVDADLAALARVWLGDAPFETVLRAKQVELTGRRELVKAFPTWWLLSPYADIPRAARARPPAPERTL
jgi:hypothetical protein